MFKSPGKRVTFPNVKRLKCFTGSEVHSFTLYAEHTSKYIVELTFIIHKKLERREMLPSRKNRLALLGWP